MIDDDSYIDLKGYHKLINNTNTLSPPRLQVALPQKGTLVGLVQITNITEM